MLCAQSSHIKVCNRRSPCIASGVGQILSRRLGLRHVPLMRGPILLIFKCFHSACSPELDPAHRRALLRQVSTYFKVSKGLLVLPPPPRSHSRVPITIIPPELAPQPCQQGALHGEIHSRRAAQFIIKHHVCEVSSEQGSPQMHPQDPGKPSQTLRGLQSHLLAALACPASASTRCSVLLQSSSLWDCGDRLAPASRQASTGLHELSPLPRFHASHQVIFLFQRSSRPSNVCLKKGGGKAPPNHQAHRWCGDDYQSTQANSGTIFCLQPIGYTPQAA
jgi:hypothetical protein